MDFCPPFFFTVSAISTSLRFKMFFFQQMDSTKQRTKTIEILVRSFCRSTDTGRGLEAVKVKYFTLMLITLYQVCFEFGDFF